MTFTASRSGRPLGRSSPAACSERRRAAHSLWTESPGGTAHAGSASAQTGRRRARRQRGPQVSTTGPGPSRGTRGRRSLLLAAPLLPWGMQRLRGSWPDGDQAAGGRICPLTGPQVLTGMHTGQSPTFFPATSTLSAHFPSAQGPPSTTSRALSGMCLPSSGQDAGR
jgi:hypothetical protein